MKFQEDAINKINLALSKKSDKSLASGFKRAVRTGDNTFSIYFMDDSKIDLTIPLPANGKDGKDGVDGINGRDGLNGTNGKDGKDGIDGRGIASITSNANGLTITYDDDTIQEVTLDLQSGDIKFTGTAGQAVGGIKANETFTNVSLVDMWKKLLAPPYTKPSLTLNYQPQKNLYDAVTESLNSITIGTNVTKNTNEIASVKFYVDNTVVHELTGASIKDGGQFSYTHNFSSPKKTTFSVKTSVTDKLVDGNGNQTSTTSASQIVFIGKSYYGVVEDDGTAFSVTESLVKELDNILKNVKGYTYNDINATYGRIIYAYPKSLGALSKITDVKTGWDVTASYTSTEVNVDGIDYYVWYLTEPAGYDNVQMKFS
ncbi:MAG: hypothetical protein K5895_11900 [Lachnospiraceae bacterium]|nr:hypothetical protein [Lachnospiraceae bacterium]